MATALANDDVKEILYFAMPNTWRKKIIKQGYNYLDKSIQEISDFFKTRVENLETPAAAPSPPAVRSISREKKKKVSKKGKLQFIRILTKNHQKTKKLLAERNSANIKESTDILKTNALRSRP